MAVISLSAQRKTHTRPVQAGAGRTVNLAQAYGLRPKITLDPSTLKAVDYKTYRVIDRIARRMEKPVREGFVAAIRSARAQVSLDTIEALLIAHDPISVIRHATAGLDFTQLQVAIANIVELGGQAANIGLTTHKIQKQEFTPELVGSFDLTNPYALYYIQRHTGDLITEITYETKLGIREIIERGFAIGIAPRDMAKLIEPNIGLTSTQANWVMNYHMKLLDAGADNIDAKVAKYGEKILRYRAMMIARTETIDASNAGQQAAWQTAQQNGYLEHDVEQLWIVTDDARICDVCDQMPRMEENQHVKVGQYFTAPDGRRVQRPPIHPSCRCSLALDL